MARAKIQLKPRLSLEDTASPPPKSEEAVEERADRRGKKIIAGHFPKSTWAELRALCIKHDKTAQQLLDEALTDLFAKYRER